MASASVPKAFANLMSGADLLGQDGAKVPVNTLAGQTFGIYFSAHWCGPCKRFTPMLAKFHKAMAASGRQFNVVFASSDKSQAEFDGYFGSMPWLAFPFGDPRIAKLSGKFKVQGIPTLVLVDEEGKLITDDARGNILSDPEGADFPWKPKTLFEILDEKTVLKDSKGKVTTVEDLRKLDAVGIYFSAHWCPPCRGFTPELVKTYKKVVGDGKKFEVIFVSGDRSQEQYDEYLGEMPWVALPMGDSRCKHLNLRFKVQGIPSLVIVDPKTGETITSNGRAVVSADKDGAKFPWIPGPAPELGQGADINSDPMMIFLYDEVDDFEAGDASKEALEKVATACKEEWKGKVEEGEDAPLYFGYGDDDTDLVGPVRQFCGLNSAGSPLLFILDLPSRKKYMWSGKKGSFPTEADIKAFVDSYVAGSLTGMGVKTKPS